MMSPFEDVTVAVLTENRKKDPSEMNNINKLTMLKKKPIGGPNKR